MQEQEIFKTVAVYATPILLAIIAFFLKALVTRFGNLEHKVEQTLIKHEGFEQRMTAIERDVKRAFEQMEELQKQLWETLKK